MPRGSSALFGLAFAMILVLVAVGCGEDDKIVNQTPPPPGNQAPLIVTYSPAFPSDPVEALTYGSPNGFSFQVLVGDPDGIDDISVVTLDIDSVIVRRFILRPDTATTNCLRFGFASNDTVPTESILPLPSIFAGVKLRQMANSTGGLYTCAIGTHGFGFPSIFSVAASLGQLGGYCTFGPTGFGGPWMVLPPAIPSQNEAILTYLDAEYVGNRVAVWDKVGANAVLQLPNLRIIYETPEERIAAP